MAVILLSFIQATLQGGVQGGAKVQTATPITPPPVTLVSISVGSNVSSILTGQTALLTATGNFSDGSQSDITSSCVWTNSNPSVATIGPTANPQPVDGIAAGIATITCTTQGLLGTFQLTVTSLIISPSAVPIGTDGQAYSVTFIGAGGIPPYQFSITSGLPALQAIGLNFVAPTLSGTLSATSVGSYAFTVQATDSSTPPLTNTKGYVLTVNSATGLSRIATLPQVWANAHGADLPSPCDVAHNCYTKYIHTNGSGDYACNITGLNQATTDWAATVPNVWWHVMVDDFLSPTGGKCTITGNWQWKSKTTGTPTGWLIVESAHPNATMQIVCNHMQGISLVGASPRNDGCNTTPGINDYQHLWGLTTTSVNGYIITSFNQHDNLGKRVSHIVARDMDLYPSKGTNVGGTQPIMLTPCDVNCTPWPTANAFPEYIGIERSYLHGDYDDNGQSVSGSKITNFIYIGCGKCWFEWNYFDKIARPAAEGHAISTTNGQPGVKFAHNFVEGGEIGHMSGGAMPTIRVPPSDAEFRGNIFTRNPAWLQTNAGGTCKVPMKNAFEIKEAVRYLLNGNVFENVMACAQAGQGPTITVRAFAQGNDDATIEDVMLSNNVIRNTENGIQTSGRSGGNGNGNYMSKPGRRWNIINNLIYAVRVILPGKTVSYMLSMGGGTSTNFNCAAHRDAAGAITTLTNCLPQATGNNRTLQAVGDPTRVFSCTPTTFNTPTGALSPPALPGTNGVDLTTTPIPSQTVVYANSGPANETGTCVFSNDQGFWSESIIRHNTYVFTGRIAAWTANGPGTPWCNRTRGITFEDELYLPNPSSAPYWVTNICGVANAAGLRSGFDTATFVFHHIVAPGLNVNNFSTWPAVSAGELAGNAPSSTLWAPAQSGVTCPTTTATASCIGVNGFMNGAAFDGNPAAPIDPLIFYALNPTSVYHAGGARQASDGTDVGADMNAIRRALTEMEFSGCAPGACGPTGPYPD